MGRSISSDEARKFQVLYPGNKLTATTRDSIALQFESDTLTVEELVAMEFINMRKNAELMADEAIRDVVITVPPYFDQKQRLAILDAASLAGLRVLELMNDGLAIALDYAKARTFEVPQKHIIFDMGAGSTSATIVQFASETVKDYGKRNKTITAIEVLSVGYNQEASGNVMTERLYSHLIEEFSAQHGSKCASSIAENPRALARLLKEATRAKQVLSANNEVVVSVESLHEDIDFRHKVTRSVFEGLLSDLGEESMRPIHEALNAADLTVNDIDSLILHGGAARVPLVQRALLEVLEEAKIARNVNADESAVMGAVFRGAGLSGSFRVKEIVLRDRSVRAISQSGALQPVEVFAAGSSLGSEQNLTLAKVQDNIEMDFAEASVNFLHIQLTGLKNASDTLTALGCRTPEISIKTKLDLSTVFHVVDAEMTCEIEEKQGVAEKVKGWFGNKDATESTATTTAESESKATNSNAVRMPLKKSVPLILESESTGHARQLHATEVASSIQKIHGFEAIDNARIALETGRNSLEAYIYRVRDYLEESGFLQFASPEEQENLRVTAAESNDWLYTEGEGADLKALTAEKLKLTAKTTPILFRRDESRIRENKVSALQKQIETSRKFVASQREALRAYVEQLEAFELKKKTAVEQESQPVASEASDAVSENQQLNETSAIILDEAPEEPLYKEKEIDALSSLLDQEEESLQEALGRQSNLSATDDPVLLSKDVDAQLKRISDLATDNLGKATYRQQARVRAKAQAQAKLKASKARKAKATTPAKSTTDAATSAEPAPSPAATVLEDSTEPMADPIPVDLPSPDNYAKEEL